MELSVGEILQALGVERTMRGVLERQLEEFRAANTVLNDDIRALRDRIVEMESVHTAGPDGD